MSTVSTPAAVADESDRLDPALRRLIAVLIIGAMAPLLDTTIVNVALNTIVHDLHTTVSAVQWVSTSYLLAMGMSIPLAGWAVARFGGRQTWMMSLVLFLVGSALAGVAWNIGSLIAFRVVQGTASGMVLPVLQTLLLQAAGGRRTGRVMSAVSMPAVIAPILGPVLGGLIVGNTTWRWIFLINIPVCLVGMLLAWRGLEPTSARPGDPLDAVGLALLSPGIAGILLALSQFSSRREFGLPVIIPLVLGLALLVAFVVHVLRGRVANPIIDVRLFQVRAFSAACALLFLSGLSLFGGTLLVPLFLQQARGYSALSAGLLLVAQGVGAMLARSTVGKLADRTGSRPLVLVGIVLIALPIIGFTQVGSHTQVLFMAAFLLVFGCGISTVSIAVMTSAFQGLDRAQVPHASGATRIVLQVGGSFGASIVSLILARQIATHGGGGQTGLITAFSHTFWWAAGFALIALIPAAFLPGRGHQLAPAVPKQPRGEDARH